MSGKSWVFALAFAVYLGPAPSLAQDAGVSGIPRGPGSAGGLNNSINDPSGIGNAARIPAPPPPSMAVPVTPSAAPALSSRLSSRPGPAVRRATRQETRAARREFRRSSARTSHGRQKLLDSKFSICRGC
jgi:hypothetical protein